MSCKTGKTQRAEQNSDIAEIEFKLSENVKFKLKQVYPK